jgi:hypothetical protein
VKKLLTLFTGCEKPSRDEGLCSKTQDVGESLKRLCNIW